jgi:hypothetical protein
LRHVPFLLDQRPHTMRFRSHSRCAQPMVLDGCTFSERVVFKGHRRSRASRFTIQKKAAYHVCVPITALGWLDNSSSEGRRISIGGIVEEVLIGAVSKSMNSCLRARGSAHQNPKAVVGVASSIESSIQATQLLPPVQRGRGNNARKRETRPTLDQLENLLLSPYFSVFERTSFPSYSILETKKNSLPARIILAEFHD